MQDDKLDHTTKKANQGFFFRREKKSLALEEEVIFLPSSPVR